MQENEKKKKKTSTKEVKSKKIESITYIWQLTILHMHDHQPRKYMLY